jgi:hypothetical protein
MQHKNELVLKWDGKGVTHGASDLIKGIEPTVKLGSWGSLTRLYFNDGGHGRVVMQRLEIDRLLEALEQLETEAGPGDKDFLAAIEMIRQKLKAKTRERWTVLGHPVIAEHAVKLEPIGLRPRDDGGLEEVNLRDALSSDDT